MEGRLRSLWNQTWSTLNLLVECSVGWSLRQGAGILSFPRSSPESLLELSWVSPGKCITFPSWKSWGGFALILFTAKASPAAVSPGAARFGVQLRGSSSSRGGGQGGLSRGWEWRAAGVGLGAVPRGRGCRWRRSTRSTRRRGPHHGLRLLAAAGRRVAAAPAPR